MGDRHLILAFDAGCGKCAAMASRVQQVVGDTVAIRPLTDPDVNRFRAEALGGDPPWRPTLIEVGPGGPRAWTGAGIGWKLLRRLGVRRCLALGSALGGVDRDLAARTAQAPATAGPGVTRKGFVHIGMLGGALTAVSLAFPGLSRSPWSRIGATDPTGMDSDRHRPLADAVLEQTLHRFRGRSDVLKMLKEIDSDAATLTLGHAHGAVHELRNGNRVQLTVLVPRLEREMSALVIKEFSEPEAEVFFEARNWTLRPDGSIEATAVAFNGGEPQVFHDLSAASPCGECSDPSGLQERGTCVGFNAKACASCVSCAACFNARNPAAAAACFSCLVTCGANIPDCCTQWSKGCLPCGARM